MEEIEAWIQRAGEVLGQLRRAEDPIPPAMEFKSLWRKIVGGL